MDPELEAELGRLMRAAQDGDAEAYERLLTGVAAVARRAVGARTRGAPWLEDVVQDVLLTVHRARHTYDVTRPFGPWLHAIVQRRTIDTLRRERRRVRPLLDGDALLDGLPAPHAADERVPDHLRAALDALPDRQRRVIEGMKFDGLKAREIAAREGLSESNVKVIAHRGYQALRAWLERRRHG